MPPAHNYEFYVKYSGFGLLTSHHWGVEMFQSGRTLQSAGLSAKGVDVLEASGCSPVEERGIMC